MAENWNDRDHVTHQRLIAEEARAKDRVHTLSLANERLIAIAITITGVGLTIGFVQGHSEILLFLPLALLMVAMYSIRVGTELYVWAGYGEGIKEVLDRLRPLLPWETSEQRINLLSWEAVARHLLHRSFSEFMLNSTYALILAALLILSFAGSWRHYDKENVGVFVLVAGLSIRLYVAWLIAAVAMPKKFEASRNRTLREAGIGETPAAPASSQTG
jgi:hypothetical protein